MGEDQEPNVVTSTVRSIVGLPAQAALKKKKSYWGIGSGIGILTTVGYTLFANNDELGFHGTESGSWKAKCLATLYYFVIPVTGVGFIYRYFFAPKVQAPKNTADSKHGVLDTVADATASPKPR